MKENDIQGKIVEVVRADGGFAFKMANKFLVGVPDIFVKLRDRPASMFEVKYSKRPKRDALRLNLTFLQHKFLFDAERAGIPVGVISVVYGTDRDEMVQIYRPSELVRIEPTVQVFVSAHHWYKIVDRQEAFRLVLDQFYRRA